MIHGVGKCSRMSWDHISLGNSMWGYQVGRHICTESDQKSGCLDISVQPRTHTHKIWGWSRCHNHISWSWGSYTRNCIHQRFEHLSTWLCKDIHTRTAYNWRPCLGDIRHSNGICSLQPTLKKSSMNMNLWYTKCFYMLTSMKAAARRTALAIQAFIDYSSWNFKW